METAMGNDRRRMNRRWLVLRAGCRVLSVMCWVLSAVWWVVSAAVVSADPAHLIRYQGQAVDSQGVPLEGPYTLTFRLYDAATVGTELWKEVQPNVPLQGGYFSVLLGQVTPLNGMNWGVPCWLSVQVGIDPELAPRQRITSVPMAISAERLTDSHQISPHNLIKNGSFESWSGGTSAPPDGWTLTGGGDETAAKNTTNVEYGLAAVDLNTPLRTDSNLGQNVLVISAAQNTTFRGKNVTFVCRVRASAAGGVRLIVDDGNTSSISPTHSGSGAYELLTVTHTIDAAATLLGVRLQILSGTATTASFDGAILVAGSAPAAFSPHPMDRQPSITNFQTTSGTNLTDQGNFRMEIGEVSLAGNPSESGASKLVTFKTAFRTIRAVFISNGTFSGGWGGIVGSRRVAWSASEFTTTGFRAAALTTDGGNFLNTSPGNACWIAIGQ